MTCALAALLGAACGSETTPLPYGQQAFAPGGGIADAGRLDAGLAPDQGDGAWRDSGTAGDGSADSGRVRDGGLGDVRDTGANDASDAGRRDASHDSSTGSSGDAAHDGAHGAHDLYDGGAPDGGDDGGRGLGLLGYIGSACTADSECDYPEGVCLGEESGFPGGMCSTSCDRYCPDAEGYPTTFCAADGSGQPTCHSRCDYALYPGYGCREGYACEVTPRYGDPDTSVGTCVPDPEGLGSELTSCQQWLVDEGVAFEPTTYPPRNPSDRPDLFCSVVDPVRLVSPVHGVSFRYFGHDAGDFRSMLMSCELARALTVTADILREYGIEEVEHMGTTVCRAIRGTDRLSQHGLGNAIDIAGFFDEEGTWYGVYDHWEHDTDEPITEEGRLLYEIARRLYDERVFHVILTPDYNAGHDNHFHVDLTAGSHFIGYHTEHPAPFWGPNVHGD